MIKITGLGNAADHLGTPTATPSGVTLWNMYFQIFNYSWHFWTQRHHELDWSTTLWHILPRSLCEYERTLFLVSRTALWAAVLYLNYDLTQWDWHGHRTFVTVSIKINSNDDKHAKTASLKPNISFYIQLKYVRGKQAPEMFSSPHLTLPVARLLKTMFLESYLKILFALTSITYSHKSLVVWP